MFIGKQIEETRQEEIERKAKVLDMYYDSLFDTFADVGEHDDTCMTAHRQMTKIQELNTRLIGEAK